MKRLLFVLAFGLSLVASGLALPPENFLTRGPGGGGALFAPSINPADDQEFYVGCDMSELFHSSDFGRSYNLMPFRKIQGGSRSVVRFTKVPGLLYAISHKPMDGTDAVLPVKSRDNGATWEMLIGTPDAGEETFSLFVDYNKPERVVIAYYGSIYFSNDSGVSFRLAHSATVADDGVVLGGVFFDSSRIYLGTSDGLWQSTDNGSTFTLNSVPGVPSGEKIFSFAGARQGGSVLLYCLTSAAGNVYPGVPGSDYWEFLKGVYVLNPSPASSIPWLKKMNGIDTTSDFLMFLGMAENDVSTVYLAGSDDRGFPNIMKTVDGGNNWTHLFNALSSTSVPNQNIMTGWSGQGGDRGWGYGECAFGLAVAPRNSSKALFTDFGFVHTTADGGATWRQAYVDSMDQHPAGIATPRRRSYHSIGLENTSCWQVAWMDSLNLFAAYSDIGAVRSTDGGLTWSYDFSGMGANTVYRLARTPGGTLFAATSNIHDMYQSTRLSDNLLDASDAEGKLLFSKDKGASWSLLHAFNHPVYWVAVDPNDSNTLYASVIHSSSGGVYVSHNVQDGSASTWTRLPVPTRTQGHPAALAVLNDGSVVATYSGRRSTNGFTSSSGIFIYTPSAGTWSDVSDPGMYYWTKDVVIDPNDVGQDIWYVCVFSGWGGAPNGLGGVYRTTNRGQSWTKINALDRVTSLAFVPGSRNEAYITTETEGLWFSSNVNAVSPVFTEVAAFPFRQPERVFFNPYIPNQVWVTGFGGGMRVGNSLVSSVSRGKPRMLPSEGIINSRMDAAGIFVKLMLREQCEAHVSLFGVDGRKVGQEAVVDLPQGLSSFKIVLQPVAAGRYCIRIKTGKDIFSASLVNVR